MNETTPCRRCKQPIAFASSGCRRTPVDPLPQEGTLFHGSAPGANRVVSGYAPGGRWVTVATWPPDVLAVKRSCGIPILTIHVPHSCPKRRKTK